MPEDDNKTKKTDSILTIIKQNFFQIVALLVALFNIWLASKLSPITTGIALIGQRVEAIERIEPVGSKDYEEILDRIEDHRDRLIRIEGKLDRYIEIRN